MAGRVDSLLTLQAVEYLKRLAIGHGVRYGLEYRILLHGQRTIVFRN
ncbi:MAG: hypothetical protein ABIP97_03155 [Chthoniobacterales bacterium]